MTQVPGLPSGDVYRFDLYLSKTCALPLCSIGVCGSELSTSLEVAVFSFTHTELYVNLEPLMGFHHMPLVFSSVGLVIIVVFCF